MKKVTMIIIFTLYALSTNAMTISEYCGGHLTMLDKSKNGGYKYANCASLGKKFKCCAERICPSHTPNNHHGPHHHKQHFCYLKPYWTLSDHHCKQESNNCVARTKLY